ncbi:MAG: HAMP domain-containing histidine kinase [Candidatus Eremiobacteraeota bacterium]|nr:HAMP domain-containing histidine kinase [Candidatus Eremiobacteraeota bacterium]MBV8498947.1 HAMP domain-containing histidine kinase [Candidatus Eremiobacteraeota bacterium]
MSLKWKIALGYSALLIVAMTVMSGIIVWRFQQILYDQAATSVNATMRAIVQFAQQSATPFSLEDSSAGTLQFLFNSSNLTTWNSANSYVQVDSSNGYPLAKTANLGSLTIPSNPRLSATHDVAFRQVTLGARSFLVEDRYLREGASAAIIHVAEPLDTLQRTFARAREAIAIVLGATAAAVLALSIVIASQATTPINELSREMREISSDRLGIVAGKGAIDGRRQPRLGRDEVGRLAQSFSDLLARLGEAFARERQFISDASHELKTPLTSINANAQMLLRWGDQEPAIRRESLETIVRESGDLAGMVNGMLTLAKADRGDELPKEPLSLAQIASEVSQNAAPRAAEKGIALRFSHAGTPIVYGDPNLLRQLVGNLVDNAIKFSERGSVDVAVGENRGSAWVDVTDTGPGIPEPELPNIFQRFYRADKARSRDVPGTGLGLAIVRSIARVHGGEASVSNSPGGGARFRVVLPRVQPPFT